MKKRKVDVLRESNVWESEIIKINKEFNNYHFEIGKETTSDIGEAVSILMRIKNRYNDPVWNTKISDLDTYNIDPSKAIYWLSGGDSEWKNGTEYKKKWSDCFIEFQEEFGVIIISILKKSKTLKDVRDGFAKHLNLSILYNFALERNII
jgi:hypothetical protein